MSLAILDPSTREEVDVGPAVGFYPHIGNRFGNAPPKRAHHLHTSLPSHTVQKTYPILNRSLTLKEPHKYTIIITSFGIAVETVFLCDTSDALVHVLAGKSSGAMIISQILDGDIELGIEHRMPLVFTAPMRFEP